MSRRNRVIRTTHNKLVRDRIPQIIRRNGGTCQTKRLSKKAFIFALKRKIIEEAVEAANAKSKPALLGELADLLEVTYTLTRAIGYSRFTLAQYRRRKSRTKGTFMLRTFLLSSEDRR